MYNNGYMPNYLNAFNQQTTYDNIDNQISRLQQLKEQIKNNQQQPAINQTFQLAPSSVGGIRYVNSIDDVNKEHVFVDTPFFSKDMSVLWLKGANSNIKTYELTEIIPKDERDIQIELLQAQIDDLKKGIEINEQPITNDIPTENETNTTKSNEPIRTTSKESEPTSISRVSTSKKR